MATRARAHHPGTDEARESEASASGSASGSVSSEDGGGELSEGDADVEERAADFGKFESWVTDARVILASFIMFLALVLAVVIVVFVENHAPHIQASAAPIPPAGRGGPAGLSSKFEAASNNQHEDASMMPEEFRDGGAVPHQAAMVLAGSPGGATQAIAPRATAIASATAAAHTHGIIGREGVHAVFDGFETLKTFNQSDLQGFEGIRSGQQKSGGTEGPAAFMDAKAGDAGRPEGSPSSQIATEIPDQQYKPNDPRILFSTDTVEVSENDKRRGVKVRAITLRNGVQVLLVSDPNVRKAAGAVNVRVGNFDDPPELPGLSHLLEHMLFLGTDQHPGENSFSEMLAKSGGSSNAFTDMQDTNYFFDVQPHRLRASLEHFSEFFKSPLLSPQFVDRERQVVDAEHTKNLRSDEWREVQLLRSTSNPDHPYHKFGTGNIHTLKFNPEKAGVDVASELRRHFRKYYTSDRISVAILGREPLALLEEFVANDFSNIWSDERTPSAPSLSGSKSRRQRPNRIGTQSANQLLIAGNEGLPSSGHFGLEKSSLPVRLKTQMQLLYRVKAVTQGKLSAQSSCSLVMKYLIPFGLDPLYRTKPMDYAEAILNFHGPGSVAHLLRTRNFANSFSASLADGSDSFAWFELRIDLTAQGQKQIGDVYRLVASYIELMKTEGPTPWRWSELQQIASTNFAFSMRANPSNFVSDSARNLRLRSTPDAIAGGWLLSVWNREIIERVLECFSIENLVVFVISAEPPSLQEFDDSRSNPMLPLPSQMSTSKLAGNGSDVARSQLRFAEELVSATSSTSMQMRQQLVSGAAETGTSTGSNWQREQWYGTEYTVEPLPHLFAPLSPLSASQVATAAGLRLPPRNVWIATKFGLSEGIRRATELHSSAPIDRKISSWANLSLSSRIWHSLNAGNSSEQKSDADATSSSTIPARGSNRVDTSTPPSGSNVVSANGHIGRNLSTGATTAANAQRNTTASLQSSASTANLMSLVSAAGGCRTFWVGFNPSLAPLDPRLYVRVQFALPALSTPLQSETSGKNTRNGTGTPAQVAGASRLDRQPARSSSELRQQTLLLLFVRLLEDSLAVDIAQPSTAGFSFAVASTDEGFELSISGFPEKFLPFLSMAVARAAHMSIDPSQFKRVSTSLAGRLRDWSFSSQPFHQAHAVAERLMNTRGFLPTELLHELEGSESSSATSWSQNLGAVSMGDFLQFQATMFPGARVEAMFFGNVDASSVLPFIAAVNNSIPTMAGVPCAWEQIDARVRQLPRSAEVTRHSLASTTRTPHLKGGLVQSAANSTRPMSSGAAQNTKELRTPSVVVHLPTFDPEQANSAVAVEFQIGQRGVKRDVVAAVVLDHLLNEEFFHQLRTRDMLGYIVDCHSHRRHGYLSLLCVVQTPFKSARTVTDRIATFMSSFIASKLQTVSEVELQQLIGSLVAIRRMPPASSLQAEATAWAEIASQQYRFKRAEEEIAALLRLSKVDLLEMFEQKLVGPDQRWLSVELQGASVHDSLDTSHLGNDKLTLRSLSEVDRYAQALQQSPGGLYPMQVHRNPVVVAAELTKR